MRAILLALLVGSVVVLSLVGAPTHAQSQARLVHPSAAEYIEAIPEIARQMRMDGGDSTREDYWALKATFRRELLDHDPAEIEALPSSTLLAAQPYIAFSQDYGYSETPLYEPWWHRREVLDWLHRQRIDLSGTSALFFNGYTLTITPVDLDGDGANEYLVEIRVGDVEAYEYREYVVLQSVSSTPGDYRLISLHAWASTICWWRTWCGGLISLFKIMDLNGDGKPEVLIAQSQELFGFGVVWLEVFGWKQGTMEKLTLQPEDWEASLDVTFPGTPGGPLALPPDGTWTFPKNSRGTYDIRQRNQFLDSKACEVTRINTYTWDSAKAAFVPGLVTESLANTGECALRKGHLAMLDLDFPAAVADYQQALKLLAPPKDDTERMVRQYAEVRLILALALDRQSDAALALKAQVKAESPSSDGIRELIGTLDTYTNDSSRIDLCAAIAENKAWSFPTDLAVAGRLDDIPRPLNYGTGYSREESGCPINTILDHFIRSTPFPVTLSPLPALERASIPIAAKIVADLNGDGRLDWIVWINHYPNRPLVFLSAADRYQVSIVDELPAPGKFAGAQAIYLPGKAGMALASWSFGDSTPVSLANLYDPCGADKPFGILTLWGVKPPYRLVLTDDYLLCEPRPFDQLFSDRKTLNAWANPPEKGAVAVPVTFRWDAALMTYVQSPPFPRTSGNPDESAQSPWDCSGVGGVYNSCVFLLRGAPSDLLDEIKILDAALVNPPEQMKPYRFFLPAARYWRGLLREKTGDLAGALSDFYTLYSQNPDSAWGRLAALHLEIVF